MIKKIVAILVIFELFLPSFSFALIKNKEEIISFWQKIYFSISNWWNNIILPKTKEFFDEIKLLPKTIKEEVEKRKPMIEKEFKKEREEMKEDFLRIRQSFNEAVK